MFYRNFELQERADRGRLVWHQTAAKLSTIWWLYDDLDHRILVFCKYGRGADFRVFLPTGTWQIAKGVRGFEEFELVSACRALGLRPGTLTKLYFNRRLGYVSRHELAPGKALNQWTNLNYGLSFDYASHFRKIREEAPPYIWRDLFKTIKDRRHSAYLEAHRFDWKKVYPKEVVEILEYVFSKMARDYDYMDNFRVAKVGNRQHYHHYRKAKERGCCGSHDEIITTPWGQFHIGFNYGH